MQDVVARVVGIVRACLAREIVDFGASFASLGADSLDLLDIRYELEREFGRDIPDNWMGPGRTILDVILYLRGRVALGGAL